MTFTLLRGAGTLSGANNAILTVTGAGEIVIVASQGGNAMYHPAPDVRQTIAVNKAPASVTLGHLKQGYDGAAKQVTASTAPPGRSLCVTYDGSAAAPINAGSYAVVATVNDPNYRGGASGTLVICKGTPGLVWASPAPIFYGTPLSSRELNALASVPGTYSYTPSCGYLAPVGTLTLSVQFTPADAANYQDASARTTLTVLPETFSVLFAAAENGSLDGTTNQTVMGGGSTTPVTALPAAGYHFDRWTGPGGFISTTNPLTVANVTASQTITAHFASIDGVVVPEDGKTRPDLSDALRVMRIALGQMPATRNDLVHGDIAPLGVQGNPKGDGAIDIYDVIGILRMTVGLL